MLQTVKHENRTVKTVLQWQRNSKTVTHVTNSS